MHGISCHSRPCSQIRGIKTRFTCRDGDPSCTLRAALLAAAPQVPSHPTRHALCPIGHCSTEGCLGTAGSRTPEAPMLTTSQLQLRQVLHRKQQGPGSQLAAVNEIKAAKSSWAFTACKCPPATFSLCLLGGPFTNKRSFLPLPTSHSTQKLSFSPSELLTFTPG